MSTAYIEIPRRRPVWLALRGAQLMLLLPLGALQLAAVVAFTTTADEMTTAAWVVAGAAVATDVAATTHAAVVISSAVVVNATTAASWRAPSGSSSISWAPRRASHTGRRRGISM